MTINDPVESIRILKKANCPTLSGKSKLTYHIGCTADSEIYLSITPSALGSILTIFAARGASACFFISAEWSFPNKIGADFEWLIYPPSE